MKKRGSLGTQLVIALSAVVIVVGLVHAAGSYVASSAATHALLDTRLSDVAIRLAAGMADIIVKAPEPGAQRPQDLQIQIWSGDEVSPSRATDPSIHFNRNVQPGFSQQVADNDEWRIFTVHSGDRIVEVGQRIRVREAVVRDSALTTLWPTVLLMPLMWVAVIVVVRSSMRRVDRLANEVKALDVNRLTPISTDHVPTDLLPFVDSINSLTARLGRMIESEKKFIADAAHELRSPIAALQLQADNLRHSIYPANAERFEEMRAGIIRSAYLVSQMLSLARADTRASTAQLEDVDVREVIADVIAAHLPIAMARNIDLGVAHLDAAVVRATKTDVQVVVKNLVENALRYGVEGGTVDVRVTANDATVSIEVIDDGPGIAPQLQELVFERFVRVGSTDVEGSGLGLAIVRATLAKYGGRARVSSRGDHRSGLVAQAEFPRVRPK
ncbi:ATP-binding protein [Paraburkholderia metrosideri]|jgi:two-component system OmpR family sensor kinase|uniref:histidine kinase n=1 Tax=Paraburkholderia metrosideri TaxID=580937 RepID=A0ABM8NJF9_9BURK|nr:ATP-binding protein [Paraburkholderia metrosideri]CAD6528424.1 Adaptive-response sensory-kinase SasA [Paraburkholderia metrosideri]